MPQIISRRRALKTLGLAGVAAANTRCQSFHQSLPPRPSKKRVAGILTWYIEGSHADVLIGKVLEGWAYDGGPGPNLELASLYVDQFPDRDMAREMARRHGFPIYDRIEDALTLGTQSIAVDGVLSVGEHGDYPWNEKEQHLYPRRRFFSEIADTLERHKQVVPVFNDKHLGPVWEDARWMYQRAQSLGIPFMAGSSLPVSFRDPDLSIPLETPLQAAVGVGYSGLDIYGIHTLEVYQSLVERRRGSESGVKTVQWLDAKTMWNRVEDGTVSEALLQAAIQATPNAGPAVNLRELDGPGVGLFLFEYVDGFQGAVFMLPGYLSGCGIALQLADQAQLLATRIEERRTPHYPHFAYLLKAIESFIEEGSPPYPVERTLLTSGILDRVLTSRFQGGAPLETPELHIAYQATDYPHAPHPPLSGT